ncbi:MAG: AMP-binding protein, partial [bacterium]|nr:AMP-binding protein [bacterium]
VTYEELNRNGVRLAAELKRKGVKNGSIVPIMGQRKIEVITGLLAVLKAGGAYLPIDAKNPHQRIAFIIADSSAEIILTQHHIIEKNQTLFRNFKPGQVIALDEPELYSAEPAPEETGDTPSNNPDPQEPAYVIYTSGTTGRPKGVLVSHQAVVNYITWATRVYLKNEPMDIPLYSSISFDMTVTSIYMPLFTGNSIVLYEGEYGEFLLDTIIEENRVGIIKLTPSQLNILGKKENAGISGGQIRRIVLGGEALETKSARDTHQRDPGKIEIYNEYGPTEATVGCMIHRYDPQEDNGITVPIGKPAANTQIYLLDRNKHPVAPGLTGEIYIAGKGLAIGYLNRPET